MTPRDPQPAPSPQPSPAPSGGGTFGGITLTVPDSASAKGGTRQRDLYGLGQWLGQNVNPGDLPTTGNLVVAGKGTTAENIVESFTHGNPEQVATIQHALLMAGYYSGSFVPKWGVVSSEDVSAFAKAVRTAGQTGSAVSDLLTAQASAGAKAGLSAAQQQTQQAAKTATVTLPNTQDLEAEATLAFQKILDRKASPQEAARFAAFYRSMVAGIQRSANQAEYNAGNPPLVGPLANVDPTQTVNDAMGIPPTYTYGGGSAGAAEQGQKIADAQPDFSTRIGGLMSLGQAVAASQPAQPTGLTQITEDSAPSASVAAQNFARNSDPKGAAANDTAGALNTFLSLLSRHFG